MSLERIHELLHQSTVDLFSAYGVTVERTGEGAEAVPGAEQQFAGVIGFTGEQVRGTLLLVPAEGVVRAAGAPPSKEGRRDWLGELSNQLLGRLKTRLLRHGLELSITTPLVLHGRYLAPVSTADGPFPMTYTSSHGEVHVWIDADLQPGIELVEQPDADVMSEGDILLL